MRNRRVYGLGCPYLITCTGFKIPIRVCLSMQLLLIFETINFKYIETLSFRKLFSEYHGYFFAKSPDRRRHLKVRSNTRSVIYHCRWNTWQRTLRKLYSPFLSNWMGYDRGDSFPFDFEPNGIPFGSKSKGNLLPWSYPVQFGRKWKYSFPSVG